MAPTNRAAWLKEKQAPELSVESAPYPEARENEVVVKVTAVGINPVDIGIQSYGVLLDDNKYPAILGEDIVGVVQEVGSGVTGIKNGDRVFGEAQMFLNGDNRFGAFQEYTVLKLPLFAKIPDHIKDEQAAVIPLGVDTASAGLFQEDKLALAVPPTTDGKGKVLIVWGGSSVVGASAIQLATASGYEVIATASKRNHDFIKSLGATQVFDYNDSSLVEDIVSAVKGKEVVGAYDAITQEDTIKALSSILAKSGGRKHISAVKPGSEAYATDGVTVTPVFATTVAFNVGGKVWAYLGKALADGAWKAKPDPEVAGHGLESIQTGINAYKKGVSMKKIVVTL